MNHAQKVVDIVAKFPPVILCLENVPQNVKPDMTTIKITRAKHVSACVLRFVSELGSVKNFLLITIY